MQEITVKDIKELLEKVEKWTNAMEVRRRDGHEFNVFHLCSVDHYENAHSRIITEFLNPRASHGMGSVFLQYFLKCPNVLEHINQKGFPLEDGLGSLDSAMVETEETFHDGRCDITIHWRGWCIVIENKIYAVDQPEQLKRYNQAIVRNGEKPILLYLTLDGHSASAESSGDVDYCPISYRDEIAEWIAECANAAQERPHIRETLNQYLKLIDELSNNQKEQKMNSEIVNEMTSSPDAFKASCQMVACVQDARLEVAKKIMQSLREEIAVRPIFDGWQLKDGLEYLLKENGRYNGFWLERVNGDKPYDLYCEFQDRGALGNLFIGLCRKGRVESAREQAVMQEEACKYLCAAEKSEKLKVKYNFYPEGASWFYGLYPHGKDLRNWTDDVLAQMIDGDNRKEFVGKLANSLQRMLEEAAEVEKSLCP